MRAKDHLGNSYPSMQAMAEHYGISKETFLKRYKTMSLKDALTSFKHYDHEGNGFNSIEDMCKFWGISVNLYESRHNTHHWPLKDSLERPAQAYKRRDK